jgi:hypothetical protein
LILSKARTISQLKHCGCKQMITPAMKRLQKDAPYKVLDCAEEEGDAVASATDDDKAASALNEQISEMFSRRSNISERAIALTSAERTS